MAAKQSETSLGHGYRSGLPLSPPALLLPIGQVPPPHNCLYPITKEHQSVQQTQTMCPDECDRQDLAFLNHHTKKLVLHKR